MPAIPTVVTGMMASGPYEIDGESGRMSLNKEGVDVGESMVSLRE